MQNIDWNPEEFLRKLQGHLTWARVRLKLHTMIARARQDEETADALDIGRLFFFMAEEAFYLDAALTVQKLFSPKEYGSLTKYLNKSLQDREKIRYSDDRINASVLKGHLSMIEGFSDEIGRLDCLRDKWFAHHDRLAFDEPMTFVHKYYVQPDELERMIDAAQGIMRIHYLSFGVDFMPGLSRETDFLAVVDILLRYREAFKLRFNDPKDLEKAVELMFHYKHSRISSLKDRFLGSDEKYT